MFKEKFLLVFLLLRPALDYWRAWPLLTYRDTALNVTDASAILFLLWSLLMLWQYRREWRHLPLALLFLSLIGLMSVSAFWSVAPSTTIIETVKFFNLALFFWLGYLFVRHRRLTLQELVLTIAASAVLPVLLALGQLLAGAGLATFGLRGRLYGTLGHPNVFAFLMLTLIILHTQYSVISPTKFWERKPALRFTVYALLITLMLLTYTRVTLVGLAIFLFIIGIAKYRRLLIGLTLGLSGFYLIFFPLNDWLIAQANYSLTSLPVVGRLTARNDDADSIAWRLSLVRETIPIIQARPLLGYGFGAFPLIWGENRGVRHFWDDSAEAHNDYLRIALELGIVGLAVYLGLIGRIGQIAARQLAKDKTRALHIFAWIIVFAVVSLSDNLLHHTPVMWLTFAYWGAALAEPRAPGSLLRGE